jgi:Ni/Co efflux regulator RcnB
LGGARGGGRRKWGDVFVVKRLILGIAALLAAAAPMAFAPSSALAERGDERRGERRMEQAERRERRDEGRSFPQWRDPRGLDRVQERRGSRGDDRRRGPPNERSGRGRDRDGRFATPPRNGRGGDELYRGYAPRPAPWRRGATLPPGYRGVRIYAYDRHRLRPPPPGFIWYQVGQDYLLTETVTGRIMEVVPGY